MANAMSVSKAAKKEVREASRVTVTCCEKDMHNATNVTAVAKQSKLS